MRLINKTVLTVIIQFALMGVNAQKIGLSDLTSLCSKSNWDDVNQSLINKGWEFYDSQKGDSEHYDVITWTFDKSYGSEKANGWFYLYTYENIPSMVKFITRDDVAYRNINNSLKSNGYSFKRNEVLNNEVVSFYENSSYFVEISNEKRKGDNYYDEAITAYNFTAKKKGGVYDSDNGVKYEYHWGDVVKTKYTLKNGKLNGEYKTYYSNGKLEVSLNFINDKKEGEAKAYYEDGSLKKHSYYSNDLENGKVVNYDLNGQISSEYFMKEGELNGLAKNYIDGKLDNETEYIMGKANGMHKEYVYDGTKITFMSTSHYLNGEQNGTEVIFINTDKGMDTLSFTNYSNGQKHGTFQEVKIDTIVSGSYYYGKLSGKYRLKVLYHYIIDNENVNVWFPECEGFYSDGKKAGTWTYYLRGTPFSVGQYQNDQKSGVWTQTIPFGPYEGQMWATITYLNGKKNGKEETKFLYNSEDATFAKCSIVCNYKNDMLNGEYISADSAGVVYERGYYSDDKKSGNWLEIQNIGTDEGVKQFISEGSYVNDKKIGIWSYTYNGQLKSKLKYSDGLLNGQSLYYKNDVIWKDIMFKNNRFSLVTIYNSYPNDTLVTYKSNIYSSQSFELVRTVYYADSIVRKTFFAKVSIDSVSEHSLEDEVIGSDYISQLNGPYIVFNREYKPLNKGSYYAGKLDGDVFIYDYPQDVYRKQNYSRGILNSEEFYELNNEVYSGNYKLFDPNNNLIAKIKVTKSKRNGPTFYLDANGKVFRKEIYKNGQLIIK
jgi:antitoxin component YwqK of YwqJK toxin-antitoxin module